MLKRRIIPVVLLKNGVVVQSRLFKRYQPLGNPFSVVKRLSSWNVDELIYLDISLTDKYDIGRDDLNHPYYNSISDIINLVSNESRMPLTIGGNIRSLSEALFRVSCGADKITLNTAALETPKLIEECAISLGSQCVVVSIDCKLEETGYIVYKGGRTPMTLSLEDWIKQVQDLGAGEILVNAMHKDGTMTGFDIELINKVKNVSNIPVIALGGGGSWEHFLEVLQKTDVDAVAAANIFHHKENSVPELMEYLNNSGENVRRQLALNKENRYL